MPDGTDESKIPRSHYIIDHAKRGGPNGLLSIVGGKLTTYRALARMSVTAIAKHVSPSMAAGRRDGGEGERWKIEDGSRASTLESDPLVLYGPRRGEIETLLADEPA
jgi:glycerol-3-phosphate dehydrogenase